MTFKPAVWYPIAAVLSAVNIASVWFAAMPGEPAHTTLHSLLAVGFAVWAVRLRHRLHGGPDEEALRAFEAETNELRGALAEAEERADFAERVLAQETKMHQPGEERR